MSEPAESDGAARRGRGRRPAGEDTRATLLEAAREVFGEVGYANATVRAIAARAGVDAAMVNHWFGGKQALFSATIQMPPEALATFERELGQDPAVVPDRMVRAFLTVWDEHNAAFRALMRGATSQEEAAARLRDMLSALIFRRIAAICADDRPQLRAALCATQMVGLGLMRYVIRLEPIHTASVDALTALISPTMRRYITGPLD
jgi:AcrR family transcriptional regulator